MGKEGGGSGAGAVQKALTRGKQREDVGAGGGRGLRFVHWIGEGGSCWRKEKALTGGSRTPAAGERERRGGRGWPAGPTGPKVRGGKEGFCFFLLFFNSFSKAFSI